MEYIILTRKYNVNKHESEMNDGEYIGCALLLAVYVTSAANATSTVNDGFPAIGLFVQFTANSSLRKNEARSNDINHGGLLPTRIKLRLNNDG